MTYWLKHNVLRQLERVNDSSSPHAGQNPGSLPSPLERPRLAYKQLGLDWGSNSKDRYRNV